MSYSDPSAIRHISAKDGLSTVTLKSDVASKYILQNEILLDLFNLVKQKKHIFTGLGLKDTLTDEYQDDKTESDYLEKWIGNLTNEISQLENDVEDDKQGLLGKDLDNEKLNNMLSQLEKEFLNPTDENLRLANDKIFNTYINEFKKLVYEVKGNLTLDNLDLNVGQDEDDVDRGEKENKKEVEDNYNSSIYYRLTKPAVFNGLEYTSSVYKKRKVEAPKPEEEEEEEEEEKKENDDQGDNGKTADKEQEKVIDEEVNGEENEEQNDMEKSATSVYDKKEQGNTEEVKETETPSVV